MTSLLNIRNMTRPEVDTLVEWAAVEGWNPGMHDADLFWAADPDAFIAAEIDREMIGGGAITSYNGEFGFMGFFIVKPEYRGQGIGNTLWHARLNRLKGRLRPDAAIGMDGVFNMQSYYAKGGFVFSHRNLRFRSEIPEASKAPQESDPNVVPLASVPFDELLHYDRSCFPAPRSAFLEKWITQDDALALGYVRDGELLGYGVIRRCCEGCKIGPLFADDTAVADALYEQLSAFAAGGPLFLDVPENNPAAMAFVAERKMIEVFGCARMYVGDFPDLKHERIFGVTTFELG
ncbi:GNAT family N-acetyltransferase [Porticoccaceae bacterium LTM1]|nr:GNAT family N-acetyltransferase [Porticoccaceae bacterium LTM1]